MTLSVYLLNAAEERDSGPTGQTAPVSPLKSVALGALGFFWAVYILLPLHHLQVFRVTLLGVTIPVYYFFTVPPILVISAYAVFSKRAWSKWEILWGSFPAALLGSVLLSTDPLWSFREWLSWIVRGFAVGGTFFLLSPGSVWPRRILNAAYCAALAAVLWGHLEMCRNSNPLVDRFISGVRWVPATSQPSNPFYRPLSDDLVVWRPRGTQGNRIPYTSILVPFVAIAIWKVRTQTSPWRRMAHGLGALLLFSILLVSQCRSAWTGLIALLITYAWLSRKTLDRKSLAGCFLIFAAAILLSLALPRHRHYLIWRMHNLNAAPDHVAHRLESYSVISVLRDHALFGVGYGQYPKTFLPYYSGPRPDIPTPDNQYLRWLFETGILGCGALAGFLAGSIRAGWKRIRRAADRAETDFYTALIAGWAGIAVTFLFFDGFYWGACNITFWSFLGLYMTCLQPKLENSPALN